MHAASPPECPNSLFHSPCSMLHLGSHLMGRRALDRAANFQVRFRLAAEGPESQSLQDKVKWSVSATSADLHSFYPPSRHNSRPFATTRSTPPPAQYSMMVGYFIYHVLQTMYSTNTHPGHHAGLSVLSLPVFQCCIPDSFQSSAIHHHCQPPRQPSIYRYHRYSSSSPGQRGSTFDIRPTGCRIDVAATSSDKSAPRPINRRMARRHRCRPMVRFTVSCRKPHPNRPSDRPYPRPSSRP